MDNFEKRMMLNYVNKLHKELDVNNYNFDELCDILEDEINIKIPNFEDEKLTVTEKRHKIKKEIARMTKEKLKKFGSCTSLTEKRLNIIKDIYELNCDEYEILLYIVLKNINNYFITMTNAMRNTDLRFFVTNYLNMRSGKFERIKKSLKSKGLISYNYREDPDLTPKILVIFDNEDIKNTKQIKRILLGDAEKADLKWNDYAHLDKEREVTLSILTSAAKNKTRGINILLYGGVGVGKTQFAKMIANKAKIDMFEVSFMINDKEAGREDRLADLNSKQLVLSKMENSCILFDEAEDVMNGWFWESGKASKALMNNLLENTSVPVFWTTNDIYSVDPAFLRRMTYAIKFEKLSDDVRLQIWEKTLKKNKMKIDRNKLLELNENYDVSPSIISNAVNTTKLIGGTDNDFEMFIETLSKVVKKKDKVKQEKLPELKNYNDTIVNTDLDTVNLTNKIKNCGKLNFSLCLYGEPGTGKSLYARHLANQLGVKVLMKKASDLISPYVGETEQNIARAFEEVKSKEAMLIFDEADTFLRNRNSAQRSWEVSQVNEMLTQMESHKYPFVCTTNLLDTLDEASLRRFTFKIKFDFMNFEQATTAFNHFFPKCKTSQTINIKGLTAGDFATVKKKAEFLEINDKDELTQMLREEVKIKQSKELKNVVGF